MRGTFRTCALVLAMGVGLQAAPVDDIGTLKVSNGQITGSKSGQPAQLRGMSLYWSMSRSARAFYAAGPVKSAVTSMNINVIRAAMGVDANWGADEQGYLSDPTNKDRVNAVVQAAIDNGIYVIIDWHSHAAPDNQAASITFFKEMATKWGKYPNVIYELYNEPTGNSQSEWSDKIHPYAEAVTKEIRKIDTANLIVVGTPLYSQRLDYAKNKKLTDANSAYAFHFYGLQHGATEQGYANAGIKAGLAVFVTEWGAAQASGSATESEFTSGKTKLDGWLSWMETNKLSSCAWSLSDKNEFTAALLGGTDAWSNTQNKMVATHSVSLTGGTWSASNFGTAGKYYIEYFKKNTTIPSTGIEAGSADESSGLKVVAGSGRLQLSWPEGQGWTSLELVDLSGRIVARRTLEAGSREATLSAPATAGLYLVRATGAGRQEQVSVAVTR